MVGIEVARSPTELRGDGGVLQRTELFLETIDIDHDLLTQTCRRCRLSVGLGEHGNILPSLGIVMELLNQFLEQGDVDIRQGLFDRERDGGVVDVLGCQAKMNEFLVGREERGVRVERGKRRVERDMIIPLSIPLIIICSIIRSREISFLFPLSSFLYLFLDIIFHRLHIMIRDGLDVLHPLGVGGRELSVDVT